jgi:hypothetical protein
VVKRCERCDNHLTIEAGELCIFCLVSEDYPPPDYRKIEEGQDKHESTVPDRPPFFSV